MNKKVTLLTKRIPKNDKVMTFKKKPSKNIIEDTFSCTSHNLECEDQTQEIMDSRITEEDQNYPFLAGSPENEERNIIEQSESEQPIIDKGKLSECCSTDIDRNLESSLSGETNLKENFLLLINLFCFIEMGSSFIQFKDTTLFKKINEVKNKKISTKLTYIQFFIKYLNSKFFKDTQKIDLNSTIKDFYDSLSEYFKKPKFTKRNISRKKNEDFVKKIFKNFLKIGLNIDVSFKNKKKGIKVKARYNKYYRKTIQDKMKEYNGDLLKYAKQIYQDMEENEIEQMVEEIKEFDKDLDFELEDVNELGFIRIFFASGP